MSTINTEATPRNFAIRQARKRWAGESIPCDIHFEITYRCNLKCLHCYVEPCRHETQPSELSTAEIAGIMNQLFEAGVLAVTFSGGEPLCRPDIFEIMDHAKERGLFFGLKTNGILITESVADRLKELGITGVHVSLYGAKPATHERVTGVTGSFDKTVRAIKLLRERNIRVGIRASIMKCNFEEHKVMEDIATKLGVPYNPDPLIFSKVGQPDSATSVRMDDKQLRAFIDERNWVPDNAYLSTTSLEDHLICSACKTRCSISPQGEVFPCSVWRMPLGNLRQQSFRDIWYGETAGRIRAIEVRDMPGCTSCELVKYCARCPGLAYMENGGISGPSSENCRLARAVKGVRDGREKETLRKSLNRVRNH